MNFRTLILGKTTLRPSDTYSESDLADVPCPIGAVYVLYHNTECLYVGQSSHVRARLKQHSKDKDFTHVEMYLVDDLDERLRLEAVMILALRPLLNKGIHICVRPDRCWELPYRYARAPRAAGKPRRKAKKARKKA